MIVSVPARDHPALSAEFEALYQEHFAFVWRTLRRFGVPRALLDDATQDVFVVAHRRFGVWEQQASVRVWLHGVAKRVASKHRRGIDRHDRKVAALPTPEGPRRLDDHLADRDQLERIARAIETLEPERRQVYVLAELEGFSAPEIAEALECKLNTVYSRLRRARADLDAALVEQGLHHDPPMPAMAAGASRRNHDGRTR
jgi:RNA polymerase sigma-70 factor (ECF subfamily)